MNVQEMLYDILPTLFGASGRIHNCAIYLARDIVIRYDGVTRDMLPRLLAEHMHAENDLRYCIINHKDITRVCGNNIRAEYLEYFDAIARLPAPIYRAIAKHLAPNMHWREIETTTRSDHAEVKSIGMYGILCKCGWSNCYDMHDRASGTIIQHTDRPAYMLKLNFDVKKQIYLNGTAAVLCLGGPTPVVCWLGTYDGELSLLPYAEIYACVQEVSRNYPYHSEILVFALQERIAELEKIIAAG